ncbi:hypothetical protein IE81DRAFT_173539 [Ceraceosorus guamensis]|uniref:Uncharacterized protein n=1 Tax=Ceraceosorus guamensis TaxID=1522189 RepID=A0A316VX36_9BASI|nr:hypothetical protein IE81DRAFT_173539 [Ceraceosorus guamensis]PWN41478.1 hypothetical protein IE81DRAFT_173539 [Ceraceosorus guamensis]
MLHMARARACASRGLPVMRKPAHPTARTAYAASASAPPLTSRSQIVRRLIFSCPTSIGYRGFPHDALVRKRETKAPGGESIWEEGIYVGLDALTSRGLSLHPNKPIPRSKIQSLAASLVTVPLTGFSANIPRLDPTEVTFCSPLHKHRFTHISHPLHLYKMQLATASTDSLPIYAVICPANSVQMGKSATTSALPSKLSDDAKLNTDARRFQRRSMPHTRSMGRRSTDKRCSAVSFESRYGVPLDAQTRRDIFGEDQSRPMLGSTEEAQTRQQWHITLLPDDESLEASRSSTETEAESAAEAESDGHAARARAHAPAPVTAVPCDFSLPKPSSQSSKPARSELQSVATGSGSSSPRLNPRSLNLQTALVLPALTTVTCPTTPRLSARMLLKTSIGAELENLGLKRLFSR